MRRWWVAPVVCVAAIIGIGVLGIMGLGGYNLATRVQDRTSGPAPVSTPSPTSELQSTLKPKCQLVLDLTKKLSTVSTTSPLALRGYASDLTRTATLFNSASSELYDPTVAKDLINAAQFYTDFAAYVEAPATAPAPNATLVSSLSDAAIRACR